MNVEKHLDFDPSPIEFCLPVRVVQSAEAPLALVSSEVRGCMGPRATREQRPCPFGNLGVENILIDMSPILFAHWSEWCRGPIGTCHL